MWMGRDKALYVQYSKIRMQ